MRYLIPTPRVHVERPRVKRELHGIRFTAPSPVMLKLAPAPESEQCTEVTVVGTDEYFITCLPR